MLGQALPVRALVGLIPRAFYPLAVVATIAVTYLPATLRQFQQIREAQAVRGHALRGLRDWLPLFMPLLVGGLERALQLSEAMTARGFASQGKPVDSALQRAWPRLAMLAGLLLLAGGWVLRLAGRMEWAGLAGAGRGHRADRAGLVGDWAALPAQHLPSAALADWGYAHPGGRAAGAGCPVAAAAGIGLGCALVFALP